MKITVELLRKLGACEEWVEEFARLHPDGLETKKTKSFWLARIEEGFGPVLSWLYMKMNHRDLRPNLSRADLRGYDLRAAILYGAHLQKADLRGVDLQWAILRQADLGKADLQGVILYSADLRGINLYSADLRNADLRGADLTGWANLRNVDLRGADLQGAKLTGADLTGVKGNISKGEK